MSPTPHIPPHNEEVERSLLGSLLIDSEAIIKVGDRLDSNHFYLPSHANICKAILHLYQNHGAIDVVTVTDQLRKMKKLKASGGSAYIAELSSNVPTASHVASYAQIVKDLWVKRSLISLAADVNSLAFDQSQETQQILDSVENKIFTISQRNLKKGFLHVRDALANSFERLDELQRHGDEIRGVPTGFADLDRLLAGLQKSNLIILAARPGMGKTAFALNIAHFCSVVKKKKVAFFSLEMSKEELVDRLLVSQADIDAWKLKTGRLNDQDFMRLSDAMGVLAEAPIFIDDMPGQTVLQMRTKARRLIAEQGIDLIVVDYLQLAHGSRKYESRVQEVGEISQGFKNLAREIQVPVLALSQLSRAIESRGDGVPQLSDLRESGSIEQDADVVMFLYRRDQDIREAVNIKIAKHRNGALGEVELYFKGDRIRFYGMEHRG